MNEVGGQQPVATRIRRIMRPTTENKSIPIGHPRRGLLDKLSSVVRNVVSLAFFKVYSKACE